MANKKTDSKKVYVACYHFEDRHGDSGNDVIGVYPTKAKAEKACGDNIEEYLDDFDAIKKDKTIDTDRIHSIDGERVSEGLTLAQARNATCIDVDDGGTWCRWSIRVKKAV